MRVVVFQWPWGDFRHEAGTAPTPPIAARHLRLERSLIEEDEPGAV